MWLTELLAEKEDLPTPQIPMGYSDGLHFPRLHLTLGPLMLTSTLGQCFSPPSAQSCPQGGLSAQNWGCPHLLSAG